MNEKVCSFISFGVLMNVSSMKTAELTFRTSYICRNKVKWVGIYETLICDDGDLPSKKKIREMYFGWITY